MPGSPRWGLTGDIQPQLAWPDLKGARGDARPLRIFIRTSSSTVHGTAQVARKTTAGVGVRGVPVAPHALRRPEAALRHVRVQGLAVSLSGGEPFFSMYSVLPSSLHGLGE